MYKKLVQQDTILRTEQIFQFFLDSNSINKNQNNPEGVNGTPNFLFKQRL